MQLFANMHLSATEKMVSGLLGSFIAEVKRMIAYGTILKPRSNIVALYKLVSEFNKPTYIQLKYMSSIYWHVPFNRVLKYTFDKLLLDSE